jgi:hypothetical protein
MKFASSALFLSLIFLSGPALAASPPPMDPPVINFQGRIEVGDLGYSGTSWFAFTIGKEGIPAPLWNGWVQTTCVEGIYNILLGKDTDEELTADLFRQTDLFLRVAFSTNGTQWETLTPDQQITSVAFSINADLLDGLNSPSSAIVGITDPQTLTNKALGDGTYTTYFLVQPQTEVAVGAVPEGYLWYDSENHALKVRVAGAKWVTLTGDTGAISNVPGAGTVANTLRDDGGAWQSTNQLQVWDYGSYSGVVDIEGVLSFNDNTDTYITQDSAFSNEYLDFYVGDVQQFRMTNFGKFECFTSPAGETTPVIRWKSDQDTGIGHTFTGGTDNTNELSVIAGGTKVMTIGSGTAVNPYVHIDVDGTAGNPALEIGGNDGAGIYQGLTGSSLSFTTQSTVVMHLNNQQQVKIGRSATFDDATLYFQVDGKIKVNQDMADNSLWISQDANTNNSDPSNTVGGALHVYNQSNTGTAISAYSNVPNPLTPLAWLRVGSSFNDQPVLRLRGASAVSNPLYIEQQSEPGASPAAGHIYMDADDKLLKYYNGVDWVALTAGGGGTLSGGGALGQAAYWTGADTLAGEAAFAYDAALDRLTVLHGTFTGLTAAVVDINGGTVDATVIGLTTPAAGEFTSLTADTVALDTDGTAAAPAITWESDANTGLFHPAAGQLAWTTAGNESLFLSEGGYFLVTGGTAHYAPSAWFEVTGGRKGLDTAKFSTNTGGNNAIRVNANNGYGSGVYINVAEESSGDGLSVFNRGEGSALWINQSETAGDAAIYVRNYSADQAFNIRQEASIPDNDPGIATGGAVHIYNSNNTGMALSIFSAQNAALSPLAWLAGRGFQGYQPVLRLEATSSHSVPLQLLPQVQPIAAANAQTGELYVDANDGTLQYFNGVDWVVLTGSAGGAGDFATRALDNLSAVAINAALLPGTDDSIDLGDGTHEWKDLYVDGTANIDSLVADTADINAGTVDGAAINGSTVGLTTPAAGKFTNLSATTAIAAASGAAVNEFSIDGTLAGNSDSALPTEQAVKTYVDGQFTSQSWSSGTGANTYVTYWTGEKTISGESPFTYDPATDKLVLAGFMEVTSSAGGLTSGMVYLSASGDSSNALYVDKPDGNYAAVNVNVQTDATGAALRIRNTGEGAGSYGIDIGQFTSHTSAHALNINNDGPGSAINISHSAAGQDKAVWVYNESAKGAIWIRQEGDIANTAVNDSSGGALHVYNNGSTGSAITAYSSETATSALVWFRASYQPVLRVEGLTNRANPFWLVPQDKPAGAIAYTVQTGEMYMGTDGSLNYYKGDGWERLVGRWTVETCVLTDDDTFNPDTPTITGPRNFNEGRPLRYRGDSSDPWLYGMVAGSAAGAVTVAGAALPNPLAEIEVGKPELIRQINFFEPGNLVQGDDFMSPNTWEMQEGYIVRATAKVETADNADVRIAIGVNAAGDDLITAPGYINLAQSTAKVATGVDISTANYSLAFGDKIFVNVDQGGEPGNNLSVTLQVVTP